MRGFAAGVRCGILRHPVLYGVSAAYVLGWTVYGLVTGSDLALPYLLWMLFAGVLVMYVDGRVGFSTPVLVILSISGFGHLAGGNLVVDSVALYEHNQGLIGYDHVVHFLGMGGAGLAVREATRGFLDARDGAAAFVVVLLGANAVGAIIEIGEYLATLLVSVARVGDYANNMQDLIATLLGSTAAAWWAARGWPLKSTRPHSTTQG